MKKPSTRFVEATAFPVLEDIAGFQPLPGWLVEQLGSVSRSKEQEESLLYVPTHSARYFDEDLKAAGIPKHAAEGKLDFHACRGAYVSWVLEAGGSVKEAQVLARHATPNLAINTYGRARSERLAEVAEAVGRLVRSTTGEQRGNVSR